MPSIPSHIPPPMGEGDYEPQETTLRPFDKPLKPPNMMDRTVFTPPSTFRQNVELLKQRAKDKDLKNPEIWGQVKTSLSAIAEVVDVKEIQKTLETKIKHELKDKEVQGDLLAAYYQHLLAECENDSAAASLTLVKKIQGFLH